MSRKNSFMADQRGAVAFEMPFVWLFLMFSLLLPLADVAVAGFLYLSAHGALRTFGQYIQYNNPPDPTNPTTWTSGLQTTVEGYTISNIQVLCGDNVPPAACSATNPGLPQYYSYSTTVTLAPILLRRVLCTSSNANPCTFTLSYSERFK
jgi:hypothetical protein